MDITRRKFVKNVAGTTLCCACPSMGILDGSAMTSLKNDEDRINTWTAGTAKEYLAAVCGTCCGACPAYLAKHSEYGQMRFKRQKSSSSGPVKAPRTIPDPGWMDGILCDGCLGDGEIAAHCQSCAIRGCAANKENVIRCSDCKELPCTLITRLIVTGLLHRAEYLPNLEKIREMGVQGWVQYEEARWSCPGCGLPKSWYDAECARCGEPGSGSLFPLSSAIDWKDSELSAFED